MPALIFTIFSMNHPDPTPESEEECKEASNEGSQLSLRQISAVLAGKADAETVKKMREAMQNPDSEIQRLFATLQQGARFILGNDPKIFGTSEDQPTVDETTEDRKE